MASVTTSPAVLVSTTNTASASKHSAPADINKERFNLLTASTRLGKFVLSSVKSPLARAYVAANT